MIVAFDTQCWRDWGLCWLKRRPISSRVASHSANFSLRARDTSDVFLHRAVIESGLESSALPWYCSCWKPRGWLQWLKGRGEPGMWWRYNGVPHRSAPNYWPLSGPSMFPSHPPQRPPLISSPSGRGFQEEDWSAAAAAATTAVSLPQLPANLRPKARRRIAQKCSQMLRLTRWGGYIFNKWPATEHISLCDNFPPYQQFSY